MPFKREWDNIVTLESCFILQDRSYVGDTSFSNEDMMQAGFSHGEEVITGFVDDGRNSLSFAISYNHLSRILGVIENMVNVHGVDPNTSKKLLDWIVNNCKVRKVDFKQQSAIIIGVVDRFTHDDVSYSVNCQGIRSASSLNKYFVNIDSGAINIDLPLKFILHSLISNGSVAKYKSFKIARMTPSMVGVFDTTTSKYLAIEDFPSVVNKLRRVLGGWKGFSELANDLYAFPNAEPKFLSYVDYYGEDATKKYFEDELSHRYNCPAYEVFLDSVYDGVSDNLKLKYNGKELNVAGINSVMLDSIWNTIPMACYIWHLLHEKSPDELRRSLSEVNKLLQDIGDRSIYVREDKLVRLLVNRVRPLGNQNMLRNLCMRSLNESSTISSRVFYQFMCSIVKKDHIKYIDVFNSKSLEDIISRTR